MEKITPALIYFAVNISATDDYQHKHFNPEELHFHIKKNSGRREELQELYMEQPGSPNTLYALNEIQYEFLQNTCKIVEDNFDNAFLTVEFLARKMAVSKSTLNRKLSTIMGLSANELIRQYRLKKAASLLISGKNVTETAYLSGFETPSYFTQCFKEFYKVTPKIYSKTIQQLLVNNSASKSIIA